jgi:hypothetical protein
VWSVDPEREQVVVYRADGTPFLCLCSIRRGVCGERARCRRLQASRIPLRATITAN